jgi:RHS repeat-associated protein
VWAQLDASNNVVERDLYGDGINQILTRTVASGGTAGVWAYFTDDQGSVRDLVNWSGAVQDHLDYSGFGVPTESNPANGSRIGYDGMLTQTLTGYDLTIYRVYNPSTGTWQTLDPISFAGGQGNLYQYVGNDPTNATDPSGLEPANPWEIPIGREPKLASSVPPPSGWRDTWEPDKWYTFYYPQQAYDRTTRKVAIITNDTGEKDSFTWVNKADQHTGITGYDDMRAALRMYMDGSIDVLIISGHTGSACNARTLSGENLGGWKMPPDIYALVRKKLSKKGQVLILSCSAGASLLNMQRTANAFGAPVTASGEATCTTEWGGRYQAGGAAADKYRTVYPTNVEHAVASIGGAATTAPGVGPRLATTLVPLMPLPSSPEPGKKK